MKKAALLCVLSIGLWGFFGADTDTVTRRYPVLELGVLSLEVPGLWKEMEPAGGKNKQPRIPFTAGENQITISYYWNVTQISNLTVDQIALARLQRLGQGLINRAKEDVLTIRRWSTANAFVLYFTLADKRPEEKWKYVTHGSTTRGNLILMVTVLTTSRQDPVIGRALTMLADADFQLDKNPARN